MCIEILKILFARKKKEEKHVKIRVLSNKIENNFIILIDLLTNE